MGIWFKEMPEDYHNQLSFFEEDVMLWQNDKVYVMDNHRDAAWCWLQQCKDEEKYNFMHIDRHYDMGDYYKDEDFRTGRIARDQALRKHRSRRVRQRFSLRTGKEGVITKQGTASQSSKICAVQ